MDIRKYLVKLNKSTGKYMPLVYDKDENKRLLNGGLAYKNSTSTIKRKKQLVFNSGNQYALDLGQKDFDAIECKICKMLYTKGELQDEKDHSTYHDLFVNSIKFPPTWKLERTIFFFENGDKIISIYPNDPRHMLSKVEELVRIADEELGIDSPFKNLLDHICFFLIFVTNNRRIAGFTAGERINQAFPLISHKPLTVSSEKELAEVGIARLWVHKSFRRQKFATRLVDILRANLYPNKIVSKDRIAFSETTNCGIEFAKKYTNRNLLVYTSLC